MRFAVPARPALLLGLTAAVALSGCALPPERAGQVGMRWVRSDNADEGAKLVLGVPGTDDVRVIMACRPGSGAWT